MTKPVLFLVTLSFLAPYTAASDARAMLAPPWRAAAPEMLACAVVTLAALALAYIGLRRSVTTEERALALQHQLAAEREARSQSEQALADNHDVLWRLVRQHERVREGERRRIGGQLQAALGSRLASLRHEIAGLHERAQAAPALAERCERALANLDAAIDAVHAVAGGLCDANPGEGLRRALERCLAEHADRHGLRYRFEAGVDPHSRASLDRAARLAVFRVLQDVLAGAARMPGDGQERELHVRLLEGATTLGLEIDGCARSADDLSALPRELVEQIRFMGGVLRMVATAERRARWSLSVPVDSAACAMPDPSRHLAEVA